MVLILRGTFVWTGVLVLGESKYRPVCTPVLQCGNLATGLPGYSHSYASTSFTVAGCICLPVQENHVQPRYRCTTSTHSASRKHIRRQCRIEGPAFETWAKIEISKYRWLLFSQRQKGDWWDRSRGQSAVHKSECVQNFSFVIRRLYR